MTALLTRKPKIKVPPNIAPLLASTRPVRSVERERIRVSAFKMKSGSERAILVEFLGEEGWEPQFGLSEWKYPVVLEAFFEMGEFLSR